MDCSPAQGQSQASLQAPAGSEGGAGAGLGSALAPPSACACGSQPVQPHGAETTPPGALKSSIGQQRRLSLGLHGGCLASRSQALLTAALSGEDDLLSFCLKSISHRVLDLAGAERA